MACMRLAEELHEAPEQTVEAEKQPEDQPGTGKRFVAIGGNGKDGEQHNALERRLVKLAGMAWGVTGAREDHRPGHVAYAPYHYRIDEVGNAAKEQAKGRRGRGDVAERQRVNPLGAREEINCCNHTEQSTMEGHAAIPHRRNFGWVRPEEARFIEKDEAEPPP